jgi:two-component system nitrate/nitrite response regulator NarL
MESLSVFVIGTIAEVTVGDFIGIVLSINPKARLVVLADAYNHEEATSVLARGAKGYLHKSLSAESFVKALQLISEECSVISGWPVSSGSGRDGLANERSMPGGRSGSQFSSLHPRESLPVAAVSMEDEAADQDAGDLQDVEMTPAVPAQAVRAVNSVRNLSPREKSILKLVMAGESNKQIARQLEITESTVKVHIKTILRKIDVRNRTQAAIWAMADPNLFEPIRT